MESTSLRSRFQYSLFHPSWSSRNSSALLWGLRSLTLWLRIDKRFSIGLRSGGFDIPNTWAVCPLDIPNTSYLLYISLLIFHMLLQNLHLNWLVDAKNIQLFSRTWNFRTYYCWIRRLHLLGNGWWSTMLFLRCSNYSFGHQIRAQIYVRVIFSNYRRYYYLYSCHLSPTIFQYEKVIKRDISVHTSKIRVLEYSKHKLFALNKSFNIPHAFAKRKFKYQPNSIELLLCPNLCK